jgi:NADPH-dependent 2,4-dienoyl-CoA reductase/sulfur reductase-like enzyme
MLTYKYLIIGGGMTADAAVQGVRQLDPDGLIGIVGAEPHPPYNRPPLTKALWKGKDKDMIWRGTEGRGADLHLGRRVQGLDLDNKSAVDTDGNRYSFDKLLLATGGTPRRLPFGDGQVIYFRTVDDYDRLRELAAQGGNVVVVGGGFIGSEIAAALAMNGVAVTMLFPGPAIGARVYPAGLAQAVTGYYRQKGVEVLAGNTVTGLEPRAGGLAVHTKSGREIVAAGVVAGLGIEPNVELARAAGLPVENGIVVDELLRAGHPDVYAAGDVASFYSPALGSHLRVEHEDNANSMGLAAGRSMAGDNTPYGHLPFFYSDLFDLGYEAVGELDSRLEMVEDWQEPFKKGVIYYLRDGRVRGVLLWNVWRQVEAARRLVAEPGPFRPADLKGRLGA